MNGAKDKIRGLAGTIIFHVLLLLAILMMALKTPLPLPGEEGVEVDLGYYDEGTGLVQPEEQPAAESEQAPSQPPEPQPEEEFATQDVEEVPIIKPKEVAPAEQVRPEELEDQSSEEEEQPEEQQSVVDPRALYKGPSGTSATSGSQGVTGSAGDQGKPDGTANANNYEGAGGTGDGISYSLSGRQAKHLPKPAYSSEEQGRIVVTIWVNRSGDVVRAEPGARGTTIADLTLRNQTRDAALRAKFSPSPDAPELQTGTITYVFIRMN